MSTAGVAERPPLGRGTLPLLEPSASVQAGRLAFEYNLIFYRPVGLQELALIYEGGMTAFPERLPLSQSNPRLDIRTLLGRRL